jgi:hypothetical protein
LADLPLVNTPVIRQVVATSRLLIQLNRHQISARRGAIISGASGTGKTTALSQLGRAHELAARRRHPDDPHRLPVVYITVPPAATPRMVAVEFARFFGLPTSTRANLTDVTNAGPSPRSSPGFRPARLSCDNGGRSDWPNSTTIPTSIHVTRAGTAFSSPRTPKPSP